MKKAGKIICFLVCLGMVLFSGMKLLGIYSEYRAGTKIYEEMKDQYVVIRNEPDVKKNQKMAVSAFAEDSSNENGESDPILAAVDFQALKEVCSDIVGWLYCPDTPMNYPVVQSTDNDYYLHRLINGEYNAGGTLFMDFRNAPDFSNWNSIIYGHNMKNGSMFAVLTEYMEQEFYEEHPVWYLMTEEHTYQIELVGGYVTAADSSAYVFPKDADEKYRLADMAARSSSFRSGVNVLEDEKLVTMSTCVYDYENARYVLVGVLRTFDDSENKIQEE